MEDVSQLGLAVSTHSLVVSQQVLVVNDAWCQIVSFRGDIDNPYIGIALLGSLKERWQKQFREQSMANVVCAGKAVYQWICPCWIP